MTLATMSRRGFTLFEILVAAMLSSLLGLALYSFGTFSLGMVSRNLATNHSHNEARLAGLRLSADLGDSLSAYTLVNFTGTAYQDVIPAVASPAIIDPVNGVPLTQRVNGVRFWRPVAGPCRLAANAVSTSTTVVFDVGGLAIRVNDRLYIPLINRQFTITGVTGTGAQHTVTLNVPIGANFSNSAGNITTGYFSRRAAFTVANRQLRYHADFQGAAEGNFIVVRRGITSANPFSLLCDAASLQPITRMLRVSLETEDSALSARRYANSVTTFQTLITPSNQQTRIDP